MNLGVVEDTDPAVERGTGVEVAHKVPWEVEVHKVLGEVDVYSVNLLSFLTLTLN